MAMLIGSYTSMVMEVSSESPVTQKPKPTAISPESLAAFAAWHAI